MMKSQLFFRCISIDCKKALGMANGEISDQQINASSEYDGNHAAKQGRLFFQETPKLSGSWSVAPHELSRLSSWLQVDLQNKHTKVTGVATQGRNDNNVWSRPHHQWVTSYKLDYSDNGVSFLYYKEDGKDTDKVRTEKKIYQTLNETQTEKISQIIYTYDSIQVEEYSREQYSQNKSTIQRPANAVRRQLRMRDLSHKIGPTLQPVFIGKKLEQDLKPKEAKPSVVNQQCVV